MSNLKHDITHLALSSIKDSDTKKSYRSSCARFAEWAAARGITRLKDIDSRIGLLNEYSQYLQDEGYSSGTIHTYLAPVCKGLDIRMQRVDKPRRSAADISKRRVDGQNLRGKREATQERYARSVALSEATGVRRSELARMTYNDLMQTDESGYRCAAVQRGKGGKATLQRLTPEQIAAVDELIQGAKSAGVSMDSRVLASSELSDHIDYHSNRAARARSAYGGYCDRIAAEGRGKLMRELIARWNACHSERDQIIIKDGVAYLRKGSRAKNFYSVLRDAAKPYVLRGDNRRRALVDGRPVEYDRLALLAVSVFELSHWRLDVTVTHYML